MENKINVAELLKDCPKGMELDCTMYDNAYFEQVDENVAYPITINIGNTNVISLTKEGHWNRFSNAKCIIFPKGKTTWEGFVPPLFKNGDIVTLSNTCGIHTFIYNNTIDGRSYGYYAIITSMDNFKVSGFCCGDKYRLATEEEKQKLFQAIKDNGYKWNPETKTLEKLVEPKFDITTLVPFEDKVLVRNAENQRWLPAFWGYKVVDGFITTFGWCKYCIPYKGNENLFKTNNDCDNYFKTWEK